MYYFFENLTETRSFNIEDIDLFDHAIKRFLAQDKSFKNISLQSEKNIFLNSFESFLKFSSVRFHSTNGVTARFYAGTSEREAMTNPHFKNEEETYLQLARHLHKSWTEFVKTINLVAPDFIM